MSFKIFICMFFVFSQLKADSFQSKTALLSANEYFSKDKCVETLDSLTKIDVLSLDSASDIKQYWILKANCLFKLGDEKKAREAVYELLLIDRDFVFDAFDTPLKLVALSKEVKKEFLAKESSIIKDEQPLEETQNKTSSIKSDPLYENYLANQKPKKMLLSLLPFGLNHFALEKPVKAFVYGFLQTTTLASNITFYWLKEYKISENIKNNKLTYDAAKKKFQNFQTWQFISLSALLISYGVSVVDALITGI